jgi:hypothetical protein
MIYVENEIDWTKLIEICFKLIYIFFYIVIDAIPRYSTSDESDLLGTQRTKKISIDTQQYKMTIC